MTEKPAPLTAPESDLKKFPFTPIFRSRLFGSEFHANANDAEWRAGVTLWLKSWDQVPAGSLPTDDIALCRLAEFGRDMKGWLKVKGRALHGWVECSDGRLYHEVVAEGVLEACESQAKASRKGKAGAEKRWAAIRASAMENDSTGNAPANEDGWHGHDYDMARAMPGDSNRHRHRTKPVEHEPDNQSGSSGSEPSGVLEPATRTQPPAAPQRPRPPPCMDVPEEPGVEPGFERALLEQMQPKLPDRSRH